MGFCCTPQSPEFLLLQHPDYDDKKNGFPNDIALLYVSRTVDTSNQYISAVPMAATGDSFVGDTCVITGWGRTFAGMPLYPQEAEVGVYSKQECLSKWGSGIGDYHICVGNYGRQGSCSGDSGGPLVCQKGGEWVLVGATSWGEGSCSPKWPSIYSSVPYFREWIKSTTGV